MTTHAELRKPITPLTTERQQSRNLASVAGAVEYKTLELDESQHATGSQNLHWNYPRGPQSRTSNQILVLKHDREDSGPPPLYKQGIGGNATDLLQNVHTSLRVNRFDRAETIIKRLADHPDATATELVHAHGIYLAARLQELSASPGKERNWQAMEEWFNTEILEKKVLVGQPSFLVMVRAAMSALEGPERVQAVQDLIEISGNSSQTFLDSPELDDQEFVTLQAILQDQEPSKSDLAGIEEDALAKEEKMKELYSVPAGELPRVLSVSQKGMGLKTLKEGLKVFESDKHKKNVLLQETEGPDRERLVALERERMIEEAAAAAAVLRWKAEDEQLRSVGVNGQLQGRSLGALMWKWYSALLPKVQEELKAVRKALESDTPGIENEERRIYGAQLESVTAETISASTILFVMSVVSRGKDRDTKKYEAPMKLTTVTHNLGKQIEQESNAEATKKQTAAARKRDARMGLAAGKRTLPKRDALHPGSPAALEWPTGIKVKIGAVLVSKLIETAQMPVTRQHPRTKEKVTQMQPAFMHKTVYRLGKKQGYLAPSTELVEKIHREPQGALICKRLPMVAEPLPWKGFTEGGYLNYSTPFIRFPPSDQTPKDYAIAAINKGDMTQIFDALNVLSRIPWEINEDVLRIQIEAWNTGEAIGNFAPLSPQMSLPPEPPASSDPSLRRKWLADVKDIENKRSGFHSQRCHQNFQLEIARAFRSETVYFPHNIDFRGRAYPVPPYLNHMGADNARALMRFAKGKELGVTGLRWLKIHLANVFGYDKASLQEREDFAMEHLSDIYDSATNPLSGRRWWTKSEDAWQTLAACCELRNALESSDPTKFVSHLPIHQDGTCNGLQHYAALGGDEIGARQVNLEPNDRPSDVYTAVAEAVKAEVEKDFLAGNPIAQMLHGKITRKVVKQPVMTNVYGVTYYGAKEQVKRQLEEIFPDIHRSALINHTTLAAYVAKRIFKSLGEMFRGAQAIQEWLGKCADRISTCVTKEQIEAIGKPARMKRKRSPKTTKPDTRSKASSMATSKGLFKSSVIWTTPLRLPVVQPYRSPKRTLVKTCMQQMALQEPQTWDPVSKRKQMQGFPPNFIHSLDATHMMLSALKSEEHGMTFASIHDSFWTHACDIDQLSEVLRDAFVHMHSENVVGRLRQEFVARYQDSMHLAVVDSRSKVGKAIKAHHNEIAKQRQALNAQLEGVKIPLFQRELLMEYERLELLKSEDPEERKRGEEMITPGSIFAAEADESALTVPAEIADSKLGSVPDLAALSDFAGSDISPESAEAGLEDDELHEIDSDEDDYPTDEDSCSSDSSLRRALLEHGSLDSGSVAKETEEVKEAIKKEKLRSYARRVYVWLPLTFPDVPAKGTFDVTRLKQSRYFFH